VFCLSSPLLGYCHLAINSVQQRLLRPLGPFPAALPSTTLSYILPHHQSTSWTLPVPSTSLLDPFLDPSLPSTVFSNTSRILLDPTLPSMMLGYVLPHHQSTSWTLSTFRSINAAPGPFPPSQTLLCYRLCSAMPSCTTKCLLGGISLSGQLG